MKTQQSEIDAPLDDLVVDGSLHDGTRTRLDLQVTTTLSFTESDDKWTDIVQRAWSTFRRTGFNPDTDRIGVAVSQTTTKLERSIQPLLARARHAANAVQYRKRLTATKGANADQRGFQRILDTLIRAKDSAATDEDILTFMKSLTIIAFDLDQEDASRDRLASIDQLAPLVGGPDEARRTWSSLTAMASRVIPSGGGVDRATVARELQIEGVTVGSDRAHARVVDALNEESHHALTSIRDTIAGRRVNRDVVNAKVLDALAEVRLLRVVGQHGAGKSAVLKRVALDQPEGAPILVLRDLRVTGGGWPTHAAKFGPAVPLATTLRELGLGGARTLFIDGADKMDAATQVTVNDVLRAIADTPDLDDWRVVMTMREENAQRVDAWLAPEANAKLSSRTIRVEGFDDEEVMVAAEALPLLRPLLTDTRNYDTVLRRPFFMDALSRLPFAGGEDVRSEIDLVELWWAHGGADVAEFAPAQGRRNVLLKLGEQLLLKPSAALAIRDIDPVALDELLRSGVLLHVDEGSTVAFSHDIYEEWVLERVLFDRRADIATAIRDGHQDLQLARPLQLLAARLLERSDDGDAWARLLNALAADDLRAIWSRVVLSAPVRSVRSAEMLDSIEDTVMRDDGRLLMRLILSVRTTETVRDLRFLDEAHFPDLTNDEREQYASEAAGPQVVSWMRLITWLVPKLGSLPQNIDAELLPLFDSWVLAWPPQFAPYALVPDIANWALSRLGDTDTAGKPERGSWTGRHGQCAPVRGLLLKCAAGSPDIVRNYLASISDYAMGRVRKQIVEGSAGLATSLPTETADIVRRAYLLDHDRPRRNGSMGRDNSDVLGICDNRDFYPASPLRPPFLQLLRRDADVGLALVRDLCNHVMEGWRRSWRRSGENPIPITIDLGEGGVEYWGDDGTYRWFRGGSHVHILDTALFALDAWAHERLVAGDPIDALCRRIARGNQCNAVLGICAGLVLADLNQASTSVVALAIGTHPALWTWDISRQVLDTGTHSNEIAYWGGSTYLAGALHTLNRLPHRQRTVRDLSPLLAGLAPEEVKAAYASAIASFLERVPYSTAEERDDEDRAEARRSSFEALRQQADPTNMVRELIDGQEYISIKPPYTDGEAHRELLDDHAELNRVLRLLLWASAAVESGVPGGEFTLDDAFDEMEALDEENLFDEIAPIADMTRHSAQSAVSATAAVLARHAGAELWAKSEEAAVAITRRAATVTEVKEELSYRGAHVTAHPPAMAAHAYAALLLRQPSRPEWREGLLQLAVDPIDKVVEAVYDAAAALGDIAPEMAWALFCLATQRAARTYDSSSHDLYWSSTEAQQQSQLADEIERALADGTIPSPDPTPASAGSRADSYYYRSDFHSNAFRLPIAPMLASGTRDALIAHAASALDWALASLAEKNGLGDIPFEWMFDFGQWLGRVCALLPTVEIQTLLIDRVDAADCHAATEIMDMAMRSFMIDRMLRTEPLDTGTIENWELLTAWVAARPHWASSPVDAWQHERGLAVSSFFCAMSGGMVCGIDGTWPNLDAVMPMLDRAAARYGTEQTAFNAMLAIMRARPDRLLPDPGLGWIRRVARARKSSLEFWKYASNGERLVLLLRDLIGKRALEQPHREIVIEVSDTLIELGVKGAAFLQQDLVRSAR